MVDEIKNIITETLDGLDISEEDKKDFLHVLAFASKEDIDKICQAVKEDPSLARVIIGDYREKKEALLGQDKDQWDKIIEREKKELEGLDKDK